MQQSLQEIQEQIPEILQVLAIVSKNENMEFVVKSLGFMQKCIDFLMQNHVTSEE